MNDRDTRYANDFGPLPSAEEVRRGYESPSDLRKQLDAALARVALLEAGVVMAAEVVAAVPFHAGLLQRAAAGISDLVANDQPQSSASEVALEAAEAAASVLLEEILVALTPRARR